MEKQKVGFGNFSLLIGKKVVNFLNYLNDAIPGVKLNHAYEGLVSFNISYRVSQVWEGLSDDEKRQAVAIIKSKTGYKGVGIRVNGDQKKMTIILAIGGFAGGDQYI